MVSNPNKLSQFWQELKRRRVVHVIIVYATAAFVIIELVGNVYETLNLPAWTPAFTIIILVIGFLPTLIFSWIYDISLKGIKRTGPVKPSKQKGKDDPQAENISWFENSIAVLPFEDMSPQKDQEYFCDGITEELINALAQIESLKVIARTSSFAFKGKQKDMREIGKKLDVETLLEGSIRKDGNKLRITAQLIRTADGSHIWSDRYDRNLDDVFAIQDGISLAIVNVLKIKLLGNEKFSLAKNPPTENTEVYNLYLKANYYFNSATPEGFEKAFAYLGQALQRDPDFALGYVGLSGTYAFGTFYGSMPPIEAWPKVKEYSMKALELDNTLGEAHSNLAGYYMFYDWNWDRAGQECKQAMQFSPQSEWVHLLYSTFLTHTGSRTEAIAEAKRALELDPLSGYMNSSLGLNYLYNHEPDKAIKQLTRTTTSYPDFHLGHFHLGMAYRCTFKMEEAIKEYELGVKLSGEMPMSVSFLANIYYEVGRSKEAENLINKLEQRREKEYMSAFCFISYYLLKGDHDQVYRWVERAIHEHDSYLPWNIAFPIKEYRIPNEPRYAALMKKVGMEMYNRNDQ